MLFSLHPHTPQAKERKEEAKRLKAAEEARAKARAEYEQQVRRVFVVCWVCVCVCVCVGGGVYVWDVACVGVFLCGYGRRAWAWA